MPYNAVTTAGYDNFQYGQRASAGYFAGGSTKLTAANTGTSASMARYKGALSADITFPEPTLVNILGDDSRLAVFQFDGTESISFEMEMAVIDYTFIGVISGLTAVTEDGEVMMPVGAVGLTRAGMILLFTSAAKSQDSGTLNTAGYNNLLLFNCEVTYLGAGRAHQAARSARFRVTANITDTLPDGRLVATVFSTVPGGICAGIEFNSANRVSYSCLVGDNSITDITTTYKPVSTGTTKATVETTGFAAATDSSVDTSAPYGIVLSGAPGSGKFAIGRYEFVSF